MVVEDLSSLVCRELVNIDDHLTFLEKRKGALLQVLPCAVVDVVARRHDYLSVPLQHRLDLWKRVIPAMYERLLVLRHAERVIDPEELRGFIRIPVFDDF